MRRVLSILVWSLACSGAWAAEPTREDAVRALAVEAMAAIDAADATRLEVLLAPTFVAVRARGELVPRREFLLDVRSFRDLRRNAEVRREWSAMSARIEGATATFVARSAWLPADPRSTARPTYSTLVTQHWRAVGDTWQLQTLQTVRLSAPAETRTYPSGELELQGQWFAPAGPGPFPAIVYLHGNEPDPTDLCESVAPGLVARGYVVWCPHRRGSGLSAGQGENLLRRLTEVEKRDGVEARSRLAIAQLEGPQLDDVAAAVAYAKRQPEVLATRVFAIGNSFGGVLALLAAERDVGVRATANFAGSAMNWERSELFRERMRAAARNVQVPVFLAQAENDWSTAPTRELGAVLAAAGKPHRAVVYPAFGVTRGEGHGFGVDGVDRWAADVLPFLEAAAR